MRDWIYWRMERPSDRSSDDWLFRYYLWIQNRPADATQTIFLMVFSVAMAATLSCAWLIGLNGGLHN